MDLLEIEYVYTDILISLIILPSARRESNVFLNVDIESLYVSLFQYSRSN